MKTHWTGLIALALVLLANVATAKYAAAQDGNAPKRSSVAGAAGERRLREIIEQLRNEEARYQNLETVIRIIWLDESKPADPQNRLNVYRSDETQHSIRQGDLFYFTRRAVQTLVSYEQIVTEETTAFDGETTRSLFPGNCVNLFAGRHEPPRLSSPHTWGMYSLQVNLPLSVYLQGTDAIKNDPRAYQSPVERGRMFEIAKLVVTFEGEDSVDGLDCLRLKCRLWHRKTDRPSTSTIWLAPDRNHLCAKAVTYYGNDEQAAPGSETRVTVWFQPADALWLPKQVEVAHFQGGKGANPREVRWRESLRVERAVANPDHPPTLFREVEVPGDLPVYKIDREGYVEGSAIRSAKAPTGDRSHVDRIVAELRRQEARCERYDVTLAKKYRTFGAQNMGMPGLHLSSEESERTVSLTGKLYAERRQKTHTVAMGDPLSSERAGWDGNWVRSLHWSTDKGELPSQPNWASLRKGGPKGLDAFRPHTALFDDWRMRSRPLSDLLTAEYWDETNRYRYLVESLGEETVQGLACEKLRLGFMMGQMTEPSNSFFFLWLAKDRNYLPVRSEYCDLSWSERLPDGVAYVDDLREVAPGTWFPFHVVQIAHDNWGRDGIGAGQIIINWRRDRQIESLSLDPQVPAELFTPSVHAGTTVSVIDQSAHHIGQYRQKEDGPALVDDAKLELMAEAARVSQEERKRRQADMDALVGTPLPEIPAATWLNSPPLSNQSLAGKVLLIDFWAEWCGPCRGDLAKLGKIDQELTDAGVVLIGVHTTGSGKQDVENLAKELGLDYPIYLDVANAEGKARWGKLFESFSVRELPHAFVVNQQSRIVAHGRLDQMILQARALAAQK